MTAYTECPNEILSIARDLIAEYHPFLSDCTIGFVMRSEAGTSGGKTVLAHTTKVPDKLKPYLSDELDILIVIAEDKWLTLGENQRKALIDHELCHITASAAGWTTRAHDFEEFKEIVDRYGLWNNDLFYARSALAKASEGAQLNLFADDKPAGKVISVEVKSFGVEEQQDDTLLEQALELSTCPHRMVFRPG